MGANRTADDGAVVIPAINTTSSTAAIRSMGKRDIETIAISSYDSPPGFASKYCDERIAAPDPYEDLQAYEETLLGLARRDDVRTIQPFQEPDIYVLSRHRDELAKHVGIAWPTLESLGRVQDRVKLFEAARSASVSVPETKSIDEWTDWEQQVIVKPRYTVHGAEYADEFSESVARGESTTYVQANTEPDREALVAHMGHVPLVQEFVPTTDEYGFFALYDHGSPVTTFQHRQRRGWKYYGGPSAYREAIDDPDLEAAGLALLDELDWHGVAMVEFLRDPRTGEYKLMEVNPRFWSSLPFTIQAGVDFPYLYWLQATGQPIEGPTSYRVGEAGHFLWGELLHAYSILSEDNPLVEKPSFGGTLRDIAVSLVRHPQFDYLDLDDPRPFLRDIANRMGGIGELAMARTNVSLPKGRPGVR